MKYGINYKGLPMGGEERTHSGGFIFDTADEAYKVIVIKRQEALGPCHSDVLMDRLSGYSIVELPEPSGEFTFLVDDAGDVLGYFPEVDDFRWVRLGGIHIDSDPATRSAMSDLTDYIIRTQDLTGPIA